MSFKNTYFNKRSCCPVCNTKENALVYSIPYSDKKIQHYLNEFYNPQGFIELEYLSENNYTLLKCQSCDLIYQQEVPNDLLLDKLYESWIDPNLAYDRNQNLGTEYRLNRFNEIVRVVDFFNIPPTKLHFLDFGMGWGSYCLQLKSLDINAYGAELSQKRVENAKKNGITVLSWEEITHHKFDFINTDDVFEHLVDPIEVLKHLVNSLKKNGVIKITVPNAKVIEKAIKKMDWYAVRGTNDHLHGVSPLEHINCFYTKSLECLANQLNLKKVDIQSKRKIPLKTDGLVTSLKELYRKNVLNIKSTSLYFQKT